MHTILREKTRQLKVCWPCAYVAWSCCDSALAISRERSATAEYMVLRAANTAPIVNTKMAQSVRDSGKQSPVATHKV